MDFEDSIYTKIEKGEYENKVEYPKNENYIKYNAYKNGEVRLNIESSKVDFYIRAEWLIERVYDKEGYNTTMTKYRKGENDSYLKFKEDLFKEYGVSDNPKLEKAFDMAWDRGHPSGYRDVVYYFDELVDLIK